MPAVGMTRMGVSLAAAQTVPWQLPADAGCILSVIVMMAFLL